MAFKMLSPNVITIILVSLVICGVIGIRYIYKFRGKYGLTLQFLVNKNEYNCNDNNIDSNTSYPKQIKILSHNIWLIFFIGGAKRQDRCDLLIKNIMKHRPDIICFQELFIGRLLFFILSNQLFILSLIFNANL
mmetsp:Transcript_43959/g.53905  ORF Transcript_43959/g.53905 Transcript_43959/m.53905 type:complete len:134 (-) Transcript_43959:28-429(-)